MTQLKMKWDHWQSHWQVERRELVEEPEKGQILRALLV